MVSSVWRSAHPVEKQAARPPCPSPAPGVHSKSCPSSRWCRPTISSSVVHFSSHLQSFPASGFFQMSQFFTLFILLLKIVCFLLGIFISSSCVQFLLRRFSPFPDLLFLMMMVVMVMIILNIVILWFIVRNIYLVFVAIPGTELLNPSEFPKWWEL